MDVAPICIAVAADFLVVLVLFTILNVFKIINVREINVNYISKFNFFLKRSLPNKIPFS